MRTPSRANNCLPFTGFVACLEYDKFEELLLLSGRNIVVCKDLYDSLLYNYVYFSNHSLWHALQLRLENEYQV